jgi:hypothetical protein
MKKFITRMNRGLVLAIVLLIGLAVYFVVDARAFESEIETVRDVIVDFVAATNALNGDFSEEASRAFVDRFIMEYRPPTWHPSQQSLMQNVTQALDMFQTWPEQFFTSEATLNLLEISSIQKQSTNAVSVQFELTINVDNASIDDRITFFTGFGHGAFWVGIEQIRMDGLLLRTGGEWRFAVGHTSMWGGRRGW